MLNELILVGRLAKDPEIATTENNHKRAIITLAVQRKFKNIDGIYDTDFIRVVMWNNIAATTNEYCKTGDLVAIKGRLQVSNYVDTEGNNKTITEVVAEKITFLSSKRVPPLTNNDTETEE